MMNKPTRVLIVEDLAADAELAQYEIRKVVENCEFQHVETRKDYLAALEAFQPDLILSDYHLPSFDGMTALKLALEHAPLTPLIIWTGSRSEDTAVDCMRAGANNYVLKENLKRLAPAVIHALDERHLLLERKQAEEKYQAIIENSLEGIFQSNPEGRFLNVNPAMAHIYGYASPREMIESVTDIARQIYVESDGRQEFTRLMKSQGIVENFEMKNYRRDRSIIWTSTSARSVCDEEGNILYYEGFLQDITERKRAEAALADNEKRFRALIENGLDSISLLSADGTLIWESPSTQRILEYTHNQFLGRNIFELMHPDDLERTRGLYVKLLQEPGSRQRGTFRLRHSDGTWRWVEAIATNMLNDPSVSAIVINYRDVTEHKQAEARINDLLAFNEKILNHSSVGILTYRLTGECVYANEDAASIVGTSVDQLMAQNFRTIEAWKRSGLYDLVEKAITSQAPVTSDVHHVSTFGKNIWMTAHCIAFKSKGEDHVLLSISDITERKKAEEKLADSQRELAEAQRVARIGSWSLDVERQSMQWSDELYRIFGVEKETFDLTYDMFMELIHPEDRSDVRQTNLQALEEGQAFDIEYRVITPAGETKTISEIGYATKDASGKVISLFGTAQDITKRKQAEIERQALLEIMQGLANTKDLQELLKLIHESIARVIYAVNFFVVFYNRDTGLFEEIYSVDQHDPPMPPAKLEKSITSYVFRSGEPLLLTQARFDELAAMGEVELVGTDSESWLGAPLNTPSGTVGVIAVQDYENPDRYSEHDKDFLASIATQVALAIEHREAGIALQDSEKRFRALIENSSDVIALLQADGKITYISPAITDVLGYPVDEFLGTSGFEFVHPEDMEGTVGILEQALQKPGAAFTIQARGRYQDGSWRWLEGSITNLLAEPGVKAIVANFHDITERKRAEELLRESEEKYRLLFESNPLPMWIYDLETLQFLKVNHAAVNHYGYSIDEFMSMTIRDIRPSEEIPRLIENIGHVTSGIDEAGFWYHRKRDGTLIQVEIVSHTVEFAGRPAELVLANDVTERKRAEEALRKSEWLLNETQALAKIGGWEYLVQKQRLTWTDEVYRIFGVDSSFDTNDAQKVMSFYLKEDHRSMELAYQRAIHQGQSYDMVLQINTADGSQKWIRLTGNPLLENGQITKVVGNIADITARKRAEDELREAETKYRTLVEQLPAVTYLDIVNDSIQSGEFNTSYISPQVEGLLGYTPDAFYKDPGLWPRLIHPDDRERVLARNAEHYKSQRFFIDEYRMFTKKGTEIWVRDEAILWQAENGKQLLSQGVVFDITERMRAEAAIIESSAQFRTLFEASPDAIMLVDPHNNWSILDCNTAGCQMNGFTRDELLGQSFDILNLTPGVPSERAEYMQRIRETDVLRYETFHRKKDGTVFPIEVSTSLITLGGHEVILGIDRDITERRRAEEALRESEALYRRAIEVAGAVPYYESYYDEGRAIKYEFIGEGIRQITGYGPDEFSATVWDSLVEEVNLVDELEGYSLEDGIRHVRSGTHAIWKCEHRLRDRFGKIHWVFEAAVELRDEHGISRGSIGTYQAITLRKEPENALQESERRYRGLFEDTPVAIWEEDFSRLKEYLDSLKAGGITDFPSYFESDPEAVSECAGMIRIADVNRAALQMYRAKSKDDLIETTRLALSRGQMEHIHEDFIAIAEGKTSNSWEGADQTLTGEPIEIALSWSVAPGYEHDFSKVIVTTIDITERKRAEAELRASEERFVQLAANIQEVFWMTDAGSGEEIYMSPAAERIWGRPVAEMMQEPNAFTNSILPDDLPVVMQALEREKQGNKVEMEYRITRSDGSVRWIWDRAFPIFDEAGKVKRIAGISADVTERKQAEDRLRESEVRFAGIVNSALDAIISVDAEQRILLFNPAAERIFQCKAAEAIGQPLGRFIPDRHRAAHQGHISNFGQTGFTSRSMGHLGNLKGLRADGEEFPIEASISHIEAAGQHLYTVVVRDITERRQAEAQLRKLSRAVEQSSSTILITDTAGNIEYVNPKFMETTGYSHEEAIGQNPRMLKSGYTSPEEYEQLWKTILAGEQWRGELLNKKKNGELYWEYATISPILNEGGETTHFLAVKEDITQRKQSEVETRRHLAELEALYENGLAVGRLLQPREIGDRIINTFSRYLPWHHVTIRLKREESDELELIAFNLPDLNEEDKAEVEQRFVSHINKVGQGMSGWVIQTGEPIRTGNVLLHPQYVDLHPGIQSGLYMPLRIGERVIGVISVESEAADAFTEQDERLLATLANQAAIAFENARLYQAAQQELAERKRAESALRTSETHYRELADSITDIFFELDQDLHYTHWNRASELLTGATARDVIGKSMQEVFGDTEEQARIQTIYESVLNSRQPKTFETVLVLNGQQRAFEINAYPSVRGVSVVAKDVTDRKRSETIMQKRIELMEFSAHHTLNEVMQRTVDEVSELTGSTIGFFHFVDSDQINLGMQTWSTNSLRLFNVPVSEGTHLPLDQAGVWAEAARQRRALIQNEYEFLVDRKSLPQGHVQILREMVIPILRNEKIVAVMGVGNKPQDYTQQDLEIAGRLADYAWDVTERKQMEDALAEERNQLAQRVDERTSDLIRANSNLARALRVKDEFLANMSHELRTPLNAILGLSESLGEQIAGPLNEKQQKYISTISESGHHLLSLINDILDLAKIEAGQITLDINKVDVQSVCQASLRMVKQLAQKKNQEVTFQMDDGFGLMYADERRLKQMIVNLLSNAVKFTQEGGNIGLEVHGILEENRVMITVWDNGIGIRESDLPQLFQPFVQLDSGLDRGATGTGLGLALVAQMARLHGGSVEAFSQPGVGSRFTIMLPWEPALATDTAMRFRTTGKFRAVNLDETNKPTILLIEDTKEVIMMIADYLELAGFKIVTAQDGIEGVAQARLTHPDLILMDVQMPRMDGLEATRKLRSEPEFKETPIIALTALAMSSDRERCLAAGMDEYMSKPVNLKALAKMIRRFLTTDEEPRAS